MPTGIYQHKKHTEERKQNISKSRKGQRHSLEARMNMSKAQKGKTIKHSGQFKEGGTSWNKKNKSSLNSQRKQIRVDGQKLQNSHYVYMTYHNLKAIPEGFIIHHIDENPLNDDPTNLRMMRKEDHIFFHNMIDRERFKTKENVKKLKDDINNQGVYIDNDTFKIIGTNKAIFMINEIFGSELI